MKNFFESIKKKLYSYMVPHNQYHDLKITDVDEKKRRTKIQFCSTQNSSNVVNLEELLMCVFR